MKKILYICSALILVLSSTIALTSCKQEQAEEPSSSTESTTVTDTTTAQDDDVVAETWYDEQTVPPTEINTDNGYQVDFDALTLPPTTTQAADETTLAPTKPGETTKPAEPTKPGETTASTTKAEEPTTKKEPATTGVPENMTPAVQQRPGVTYFDKYVKSILSSGNYTATVTGRFQGYNATVSIYKKSGSTAYSISTTYHGVPVSCRYFYSGGNVYIIVPSLRSFTAVDVADPIVGTLESMVAAESVAMTADGMTYCGVTKADGYVRESYKASDGTYYHYYFGSGGLYKIQSSTGSTIKVSLSSGVSNGGVFSVPSGYKKVDVEVLVEKLKSY